MKTKKTEKKTVYELSEMMNNLLDLNEEQWGCYAFSREPLRGKIKEEERSSLIRKAIACGQEEARKFKKDQKAVSLEKCIADLGIQVQKVPKANDGGFVIFAQFKPPDKITVFTDCLERSSSLLRQCQNMPFSSVREIEELLLAHELFHYIENRKKKEIFTQTYKLPLWSLGRYHHTSRVECLSEIAGMSFAQTLCGTAYSPYLLDVFLVCAYQPEAASELYEGILRVTNMSVKEEAVLNDGI